MSASCSVIRASSLLKIPFPRYVGKRYEPVRKKSSYVRVHGPVGEVLLHALQSQAAYAQRADFWRKKAKALMKKKS
jgi:hypothetical protein